MSATRIVLVNELETASRDVVHGGGGTYDDAVMPMTYAQTPERRLVGKSDGTNNMVLVFAFSGGIGNVGIVGLLGMGVGPGASLTACAIHISGDGTTWIPAGTITIDLSKSRDALVATGFTFAAYVRFTLTNTGVITVGRLFCGGGYSFAGAISAPGSEDTALQNRLEQRLMAGAMNVNVLGYPGRTIVLEFGARSGADRDSLAQIADWPASVVLFDTEDKAYECIVHGGTMQASRQFVDTYDCALELARLP